MNDHPHDLLGRRAREALGLNHRQCTATAKTTGEQCKKSSLLGQFVCEDHGGKAPQAQRAARLRLLALMEPALETLDASQNLDRCDKCGRTGDMAIAVRAAIAILNRTGFAVEHTVNVHHQVNDGSRSLSLEEAIARTEEHLHRLRQTLDAQRIGERVAALTLTRRSESQVIDAVLVPEKSDDAA